MHGDSALRLTHLGRLIARFSIGLLFSVALAAKVVAVVRDETSGSFGVSLWWFIAWDAAVVTMMLVNRWAKIGSVIAVVTAGSGLAIRLNRDVPCACFGAARFPVYQHVLVLVGVALLSLRVWVSHRAGPRLSLRKT